MTATYSIQGADFSTRQEGDVKSAAHLIGIFETYDWATEHALQTRLESTGEENCPSGLSIVREPFVFMHICPNEDGTVEMHCIHVTPTKLLGLFKSNKTTDLQVSSLPNSVSLQAITKFLAADNDWLLANIKED